MTTADLLRAAELEPGSAADGDPVPLPGRTALVAASVTVRATFAAGTTGAAVVSLFATPDGTAWDTQAAQSVALLAPGTDEPAQTTVGLASVAVAAIRARLRNQPASAVRDITVTMAVR